MTSIRVVKEGGMDLLDEFQIPASERTPQIVREIGGQRMVALAERQLEDGTWIYRRVHTERSS